MDLQVSSIAEMDVDASHALTVSRKRSSAAFKDEVVCIGDRDVDSIRIYLKDSPASRIALINKTILLPPAASFECALFDLRSYQAWHADYPLDIVTFDLPSMGLNRWARDHSGSTAHILHYEHGIRRHDEVLQGFARAVLPYLDHPETAPRLFVDYLLQGVCTYMVRTYGRAVEHLSIKGGLAPWQERRAKELIVAHLDGKLSLQRLAAECSLSVSHFTRSFLATVGESPHQWMMSQRIDRAKGELLRGDICLFDIAIRCGFADQSHFSRIFTKRVGISPSAWRRHRGLTALAFHLIESEAPTALIGKPK